MADNEIPAELEQHCLELQDKVRELLEQECVQVRTNVLLTSLFGATNGAPYQMWAPYIAIFLSMVVRRDGVHITVLELNDDDEGDEDQENEDQESGAQTVH